MYLFPKKSLGQHFLTSTKALGDIISAGMIEKDENILEIGPGTGILTIALLEAGAKVIAIEKDARSIELLRQSLKKYIDDKQLTIIEGDVLEMKDNIIQGNFGIIANIPYYITGAILQKFLEHGPRPHKMILLVQKEVAERIVSRDGKESILSISVKAFGKPKIISRVPRGSFNPPPTVDSAILAIYDISDRTFSEKNLNIQRFFEIVNAGFAHKRKFAMKNLEIIADRAKLEEIWSKNGLDPKIRAEKMTLNNWIDISYELGVE